MAPPLLIVGASVRAAAFSALRCGYDVAGVDLFGDADLCRRCAACRVDCYPAGLIDATRRFPSGPWLYTGGLENHPDVVDAISADRLLLGNRGVVLSAVRDLDLLDDALADVGLQMPSRCRDRKGVPRDGSWLVKRTDSTGGRHVRRWRGQSMARREMRRCYFQQFIAGQPAAVLYAMNGRDAIILGVTEQIVGVPWTGAEEFAYAGSLGPVSTSDEQRQRLERLGRMLAGRFALRGLVGVDVILTADEVWPIDVNPRYPASAEILQWALNLPMIALHVAACQDELPPPPTAGSKGWYGKAILYARRPILIDAAFTEEALAIAERGDWPAVADVPNPGTKIEPGQPVMTVFAKASSRKRLVAALQDRIGSTQAMFDATS